MNISNKNKKCDIHTSEVGCDCGTKRRFNFIVKNRDEFYFIPSIRLTLSKFMGDIYKGRYLGNGFKKLNFSFKFLNYKIEKEKKYKIK
jgi:hypothetical protein